MATIKVARVEFDLHEYEVGPSTHMTVGEAIDRHIGDCIARGAIVQEVAFLIEPAEWHRMVGRAFAHSKPGEAFAVKTPTNGKK